MHEIIKRYADQTRFVNSPGLFLFRRSPNFLRQAAVYSLYNLRRRSLPGTRFLILAQGRSGSTVLVDLMNSHPDIVSWGEILDRNVVVNVRNPRKWAEGLCTLSRRPACGFKVKIYQIERHQGKDPRALLTEFHENGWKLIYLKRTNLLRHAISDIRSEKTGLFHVVDREGEVASVKGPRGKIRIEWSELLEAIDFRQRCLEGEETALKGLPHLVVEYESGLLNPDAQPVTMNRVFSYLGLPEYEAGTSFQKVGAKNLGKDIENFEELENHLKQTEFGRFLGWG